MVEQSLLNSPYQLEIEEIHARKEIEEKLYLKKKQWSVMNFHVKL